MNIISSNASQAQSAISPAVVGNFPTIPIPSYSFVRNIGFKTLISQFENGAEQRRNKWSQGKLQFTLTYNILSSTDITILWNFYVSRKGSFESFNFTDLISGTVYLVRFVEDNLSIEEFAKNVGRTGLKLIQVL